MEIPSARNKMVNAPVAQKGFHFASDGTYFAEYIEAESIEAATALYHKTKRLLIEQSTVAPKTEVKTDVQ